MRILLISQALQYQALATAAQKIIAHKTDETEKCIDAVIIPANCLAENIAEDLRELIQKQAYSHVISTSDSFGKNFMPRLAAMMNMSMISDVIAINAEDCFARNIYAGNIQQTVKSLDPIKFLTVRASAFQKNVEINSVQVSKIAMSSIGQFEKTQYIKSELTKTQRPELASAKIIVSGGRGLQKAENFSLLEALADKLNAAIGASRAAVDAGWVSNDFQVGQTGKIVAPDLYIAIGLSGAIQHLAGMKDSKVIVAINKDPDAPIFQIADYGLVGDLFEIIPKLLEKLK